MYKFLNRHFVFFIATFVFCYSYAQTGNVETRIAHNTTTGTSYNSIVNYSVTLSSGWINGVSQITSLILKNESGATVYTHSGTSINYGTISNLAPGVYQFTGNASTVVNGRGVSVPLSNYIWVGYKPEWQQSFDMRENVTMNSTVRSMVTAGQTYSYAQSFNLSSTGDCWMEMRKTYATTNNDSRVYWILEPISNPSTFSPSNNIAYIEFKTVVSGTPSTTITLKYKKTGQSTYSTQVLSTSTTDKIRLVRKSGATTLQLNNSITNITITGGMTNISGTLAVTVLAKEIGDEAIDIVTSYGYPSTSLPVSYSYNTTTETGSIVNNISPISGIGITGPYHYMADKKELPTYSTLYKLMRDSIYKSTLDSALFFRGNISANQFTFSDIPASNYYISVYDSRGVRIYNNRLAVNPLTVESNTGTSIFNNTLTCSENSSVATFENYLSNQEQEAELTYYVTNNSSLSYFGLMNTGSVLVNANNIYYGFRITGGNVNLIQAGVIGSTNYSYKENQELKMVKSGNSLEFWVNGVLKGTSTLPSSFTYKTGVAMNSWGVQIIFNHHNLGKKKLKRFITTELASCLGSFGKVSVQLVGFSTPTQYMADYTVTLTNASSVAQTLDAGSAYPNYSFSNLLGGTYTLTTSFNWRYTSNNAIASSVTYNDIVYVDNKITWDYHNQTAYGLADQSLTKNSNSAGTLFGNSTSANKLTGTTGYVNFGMSFPSGGLIGVNALTWTGNSSIPTLPTTGIWFVKLFGSYFYYDRANSTFLSGVSFIPSDRFRSTISTITNNQTLQKILPSGALGSTILVQTTPVNSNAVTPYPGTWSVLNKGFINMSTNLGCSTPQIYAKLERDLKGVKYKVYSNKFYFFYDEEYASTASLTYNVYNAGNAVVISTSTQVLTHTQGLVNREYGDNRYSLDVTSLASGAYILEVINEKNEKRYLRFEK